MTKLLLIGDLNDMLLNLSEHLGTNYQVQMCSENAKNIRDLARIYRPGILVFNLMEWNAEVKDIFASLAPKLDQMPVLVIAQQNMKYYMEDIVKLYKRAHVIYRPVQAPDVLQACYRAINDIPEKEESKESKMTNVITGEELGKRKILIVDDNALVLRNIKSLLEPEYEVILATSGQKGLDVARMRKPDLILLDYEMPVMDGKETFEIMKKDNDLSNIPVVFLTSVSDREQILAVLKSKPYGYVLKPPSKEKLFGIIKEALGE